MYCCDSVEALQLLIQINPSQLEIKNSELTVETMAYPLGMLITRADIGSPTFKVIFQCLLVANHSVHIIRNVMERLIIRIFSQGKKDKLSVIQQDYALYLFEKLLADYPEVARDTSGTGSVHVLNGGGCSSLQVL